MKTMMKAMKTIKSDDEIDYGNVDEIDYILLYRFLRITSQVESDEISFFVCLEFIYFIILYYII